MVKSIVLVYSKVMFWPNNLPKHDDLFIKVQRKDNAGEDLEPVGFTLNGNINWDQMDSTKTVEFVFSEPQFSEKFSIGLKDANNATTKFYIIKLSFRAGKIVFLSSEIHYNAGRSHKQGEDGFPIPN